MTTGTDSEQADRFTDWYGFDTENDEKGRVTLTALVHESGAEKVWKRKGCFEDWCDKQTGKGSPIVICHNLEYDLVNEFGPEKFAEMQLNYLKGRLISAKRGNVTFRDSFNHFRMSLAQIGECIGIKKLDFDINSHEYVATDAWICLKVMTRARDYIAQLGGRMGATSGSSAVSVWRHMTDDEFCTGPLDTPWLRKGYYGGRTEIFRPYTTGEPDGEDEHGKPKYTPAICGYDINSMYPQAMLNDFPEYLTVDPLMEKAKGMAEVTISIPHSLYVAPLPYRGDKGQLLYPVGVIRGVWVYDEIRQAVKRGAKVLKVHEAYGCNVIYRPFDQYIHTLYNKRKGSSDESERLFLKVLMNSLYGKIASKNVVTRTVSRYNLLKSNNPRINEVKWVTYQRGLLDFQTPAQPYVNVCWGSMITAYARLNLLGFLEQVPPEKLIYCDTDSVYCKDHDIPCGKELGQMKLEKRVSVMKVVQPKAYQLDDYYKAKGVPKPKYDKNTDQILIDFAKQYIEEGTTAFQAPIRFRGSLHSRRGKANEWVTHTKSRKSAYDAKILSADRYYPPVCGEQLSLLDDTVTQNKKQGKT